MKKLNHYFSSPFILLFFFCVVGATPALCADSSSFTPLDVSAKGSSGSLYTEVAFDSSGTYSWTVPDGVNKAQFTVAGAGGGNYGTGGGYPSSGESGGFSRVTGPGVNIVANGGQGGFSRGSSSQGYAALHGTATGGSLNLYGGGAAGGTNDVVSWTETSTVGGNGGLSRHTTTISPGDTYSITVGAGGKGHKGLYGPGTRGSNGYVTIRY